MRAKLKELYSTDIDLKSYQPESEHSFGIWVGAMIGPEDSPGSESFDIFVCTPEWLKLTIDKESIIWGFHKLIVPEWNTEQIRSFISRYIERTMGNSWEEIARKLRLVGIHESLEL
jgi:hypothetical protein